MLARLAAALVTLVLATPSLAAQCGGDFQTFIATISREAASQGVSRQVIDQAFAGVAIDPNVLSFDRRQRGTFRKSFEEYAATRVTQGRINRARQLLQRHAALLSRVERQFGVPKELIVAIWGLESDFGAGDIGKMPVVRTLATLAHDCRRTELFQKELHRCADDPAARPPDVEYHDRRLCRRTRPDPVPAVVLHQVRRRLRRRRPRRPAKERAGRAGLDREPAQGEWLAAGRAVSTRARRIFR